MSFIPIFKINDVVSNSDIVKEFHVGNMGGMRRSKATITLVIISDPTKGLYEDKWVKDILYYTGMGKKGNQILYKTQNKTLAESDTNGVDVHLFEVLKPGEYTYKGLVELAGEPYQEDQRDEDDQLRQVWIFPLRLNSGDIPIDEYVFSEYEAVRRNEASKLPMEQLLERAKDRAAKNVSMRTVKSTLRLRDPYISEYVKRIANGKCQLCNKPAPFKDYKGKPYLESHHIVWIANGGEDTIENTVALCPNCHRKMHVIGSKGDILKLKKCTQVR